MKAMPKVNEIYAGQFLTADDLQGKRVRVKINSVEEVEVPDFQDKSVMRNRILIGFEGRNKKMLLGARNAHILGDAIDNDADNWVGQEIEVFSQREQVAGSMKDVLKVSPIQEVANAEDGPGF